MSRTINPLSKDFWMPNSSGKSCFKCDRLFNTLRRRHHCRYCGLIFCSKCSKTNIRVADKAVLQRACESCAMSIQRDLVGPVEHHVSEPEVVNELHESCSEVTEFEIKPNSSDKVKELLAEITEDTPWDESVEGFLHGRAKKFELGEEWREIVVGLVRKVVRTVCPSVLYRRDKMNINEYLKIIKIPHGEKTSSRFIQGLVLKKSVTHRKMNPSVTNAKILMLRGGTECLETESRLVSMEKLISQEKDFIKILVKKIRQVEVNFIVNEGSMSQAIIEKLSTLKIPAVIKVKDKNINLLSRACQGFVLDCVDRAPTSADFIGKCGKVSREIHNGVSYLLFEDLTDPTLVGSILLFDSDKSTLDKVASVIRTLVVEYRNLLMENQLLQQLQVSFSPILFAALESEKIVTKTMSIRETAMCVPPEAMTAYFYSDFDCPLGDYVIETLKKSEDRCPNVNTHLLGNHVQYYVKNKGRVKITVCKSSAVAPEIIVSKECRACLDRVDFTIPMTSVVWEYSFHKFINNLFTPLDMFHASNQCRHDYFKFSKFSFQHHSKKLSIEYEEIIVFDILPTQLPLLDKKSEHSRTQAAYKQLLSASSTVVDELRQLSTSLAKKIVAVLETDQGQMESWTFFQKELQSAEELLVQAELGEVSQSTPVLALNAAKRKVYLACCEAKLIIEHLNLMMQQTKSHLAVPEKRPMPYLSPMNLHPGEEEKKRPASYDCGRMKQTAEFIDKEDALLKSPEFTYLKSGCPTLPLGYQERSVLVEENDSLSIIAYTLNSQEYHEQISAHLPSTDTHEIIETELLRGNETHFSMNVSTYGLPQLTELAHKQELRKIYGPNMSFEVKVYFPRQFHCVRLAMCGSPDNFLSSIASSLSEVSQPGKKGSFKLSHDQQYIIKLIDSREFRMFIDMAPNYFRHICKALYHSMPSLLVQVLGAFKIHVKNHTFGRGREDLVLVYKNLMCEVPKPFHVYDLKGTTSARRETRPGDGKTKMDLNFLKDFNGIPLMLSVEAKRQLYSAIWNDTLFLSKQNIVDYSLLLVVSSNYKKVALGIIDYMEQYTFEKAIEHKYRRYINNVDPTVTHTRQYKDRFRHQLLRNYFMSLED